MSVIHYPKYGTGFYFNFVGELFYHVIDFGL